MTSPNGTFSALLALCAENSPVPGEFPTQRPVTRSFDDFFDLRLNKGWSKQSRRQVRWRVSDWRNLLQWRQCVKSTFPRMGLLNQFTLCSWYLSILSSCWKGLLSWKSCWLFVSFSSVVRQMALSRPTCTRRTMRTTNGVMNGGSWSRRKRWQSVILSEPSSQDDLSDRLFWNHSFWMASLKNNIPWSSYSWNLYHGSTQIRLIWLFNFGSTRTY